MIADPAAFESQMNLFLTNRAATMQSDQPIDPTKPYGTSLPWLALFFAVLASGAQSTGRPAKERELTSQVYRTWNVTMKSNVPQANSSAVCCSYQALRMANFLVNPALEAIQAFLVISNVLSYNMNPGVAYILMGLATRMAFSIGLQTDSPRFSVSEQYLRSRVWWALAWQDSHFSVSYDRPTASAFCGSSIPYRRVSTPGHRSYAESMFRIIKLTQEIIRERTLSPRATMTWATIHGYKEEAARIVADAATHLRDRKFCTTTTQHLERLALKLHSSYVISELCRPALQEPLASLKTERCSSSSTPALSPLPGLQRSPHSTALSPASASGELPLPVQLRRDCVNHLERTIDAYVELHSISQFAARSWIGIQRAVSAAFLLGTLPDIYQESRVHTLLRDLEHVISQRAREELSFDDINGTDSFTSPTSPATSSPSPESPHWARSMAKSLKALGKMNDVLATPAPTSLQQLHQPQPQPPQQQGYLQTGSLSVAAGYQSHPRSPALAHSQGPPKLVTGTQFAVPPVATFKQETYSPTPGSNMVATPGGGTASVAATAMSAANAASSAALAAAGMPITPDSTSSGDWNYMNMNERALEFVQPGLWG